MIAVIFTSQRTAIDENYLEVNNQLEALAAKLPGFIKTNSVRQSDGYGISISYWKTMENARLWKKVPAHQIAQDKGKEIWYEWYRVEVCEIVRAYDSEKVTEH